MAATVVGLLGNLGAAPASAGDAAVASRDNFIIQAGRRIVGHRVDAHPSTANCESRCRSEAMCVAYSLSRNGICELFAGVDAVISVSDWRSGVRAERTR